MAFVANEMGFANEVADRVLFLTSRILEQRPPAEIGTRGLGAQVARSARFKLEAPLELSALAKFPLILIHAPNQIRSTVDAALKRLRKRAEPVMEVSSSPLLLDLVEDGHGYTVLPQSLITAAVQQGRISAAPVGGLRVIWVAAWPKGRSVSRCVQITLDSLFAIV